MKTAANKMWKKIAVFTMALTVMCGTVTVMGKTTGASFVTAAYEEQQEEAFEIQSCEHGKLHAELVEGDDQEFNAILVTPEPDAGYMVAAVYANGAQVAINDNDEYLIAYTGEKLILSAEFVPISEDPGSKADTDSVPKTGAAAAGLGVAGAAVAVVALAVLRRKK